MRGGLFTIAFGVALALAPRASRADESEEVKVHVDGDARLVIERKLTDSDLWESVCRGACDEMLPRDGSYRLTGRGIRPSLPIALIADGKKPVSLAVKSRYDAGWYGAVLLTIIGPTAMVGGVFAAIAGASQNNVIETPCPFNVSCNPIPAGHALLIGGFGTIITGALMTAAGIFGLSFADHSLVTQIGTVTVSARNLTISF